VLVCALPAAPGIKPRGGFPCRGGLPAGGWPYGLFFFLPFFPSFSPFFFFPLRGIPVLGRAFPCRNRLSPVSSEGTPDIGVLSKYFAACGGRRLRRAFGTFLSANDLSNLPETGCSRELKRTDFRHHPEVCYNNFGFEPKFATTTWVSSSSLLPQLFSSADARR
jgi:hypothetical protein